MKRFITLVGALLTLWVALPAQVEAQSAPAAREFKWERFGEAPYAPTRAVAMQTREAAFRCLGLPPEVVRELMRVTASSGTRTRLTNGTRLDGMLSRGCVLHSNVLVAFRSPVQNMEYAAPAEVWTITVRGSTYTVYLPDICNNWSVVVVTALERVDVVSDPCVYARLTVRPGDTTLNYSLHGNYPPSRCTAYQKLTSRGSFGEESEWDPLPTSCPTAPCDFRRVTAAVGLPLIQSGGMGLTPGEYLIRLPREFAERVDTRLVLCLSRGRYVHSCGLGIQTFDYLTERDRKVATVFYSADLIPSGRSSRLSWSWPTRGQCLVTTASASSPWLTASSLLLFFIRRKRLAKISYHSITKNGTEHINIVREGTSSENWLVTRACGDLSWSCRCFCNGLHYAFADFCAGSSSVLCTSATTPTTTTPTTTTPTTTRTSSSTGTSGL